MREVAACVVSDGTVHLPKNSLETVRSATLMPSFKGSPWMRGAPQSGFAVAIRMFKAWISG